MKRLVVITAICLLSVAALFIGFSSLNAYREMLKIRTGSPWRIPSRIYSRELTITPGVDISRVALMERLSSLRYRKVVSVNSPGEYSVSGEDVQIFLHSFDYPEGARPAVRVRLILNGNQVARIISPASGSVLPEMRLEPECIAQVFDAGYEDREIVSLTDCPKHFLEALLCVEDRRFYEHSGIDVRSMVRALLADLYQGHVVEGGSTITQQLVKNLFLTNERTYARKLKEIWLSLIMETAFTKDEILGMYVNEVYLGRMQYAGIHGFGRAARLFFDKDLSYLELPEAALLVGLVRSPNRYSPYTHPSLALSRRNTVLQIMLEEGKISRGAYESAIRTPLAVIPLNPSLKQAPYFIDHVISSIHDLYPDEELFSRGGLHIFTTLDMHMQRVAEGVLAGGRNSFGRDIEAALIIVDPSNGGIMAMVGGRSYAGSQYNRATSIRRSIGSIVKPVIYYCALKNGYTLASLIEDGPLSVPLPGNAVWSPTNFDGINHGQVMLIDALAKSYNLATVRLGLSLGLDMVTSEIRKVLPHAQVRQHPSILLGAIDCSPLDVALMYAAFANGGFKVEPQCIRSILDENGTFIWKAQGKSFPRVLDVSVAYLIDTALIETLKRGTASAAKSYGVPDGVCGKTGTTNDLKDSWFAAYTQDLALVVWLGKDAFTPTGFTGATGALPLASRILAQLAAPRTWNAPDNITFCSIDPMNGKQATNWTALPVKTPFLKGTEPREVSEEGMPRIWKILRAIFPFKQKSL